MGKNIRVCPYCGRRYSVNLWRGRVSEEEALNRHVMDPRCQLVQVNNRMAARGMKRCSKASQTVRNNGYPVELVPDYWTEIRIRRQRHDGEEYTPDRRHVVSQAWYAKAEVVDSAMLLAGVSVPKEVRTRWLGFLVEDPDARAAVSAAVCMMQGAPRKEVHRMVKAMMRELEGRKNERAAQGKG